MAFYPSATSMHNRNNTDIDIIKENCKAKNLENNRYNCVLIITGSFNPIHRSHIKSLEIARHYLETYLSKQMNVLAAYLSPTHDSYVQGKLSPLDFISAEERCQLCEEVIKSDPDLQSWISVTKGEAMFTRFVDFDEVCISLAKYLNQELYKSQKFLKYPLQVVYVCGLDHFNKCSHVAQLSQENNMACAVIYRPGASEHEIKYLQNQTSTIYYVKSEEPHLTFTDISSTLIRRKFHNRDKTDLLKLTYPCVIDYLENKYTGK